MAGNGLRSAMRDAVAEPLDSRYHVVVGSDVSTRDGMYLEISEGRELVLEVFYSDTDDTMSLTAHRTNVPLPLVEWAIAEAKVRLTPSRLS